MTEEKNIHKNHYEIAHLDPSKDKNPHIIIDTKNPISVGDIIKLCDCSTNEQIAKYVVKSIVHTLVAKTIKKDENRFIQEGNWNTFLYVEDYK